jgi:hypothetical protein
MHSRDAQLPCLWQQHSQQPRKASINNEWIKEVWLGYTMEYYSASKKNEILSFAAMWMIPENIMLSEINQAQKDKNHTSSLTCGP